MNNVTTMGNFFLKTLVSTKNFIMRHFVAIVILLTVMTITAYAITTIWIFYFVPDDYLQGELVKIMYIHVPCAWLSLVTYILLGIFAVYYLIYNNELCNIASSITLTISLHTSAITIITGSIWGKAAWGTWWIWDPRLSAVLIQFCILSVCYMMQHMHSNYHSSNNKILYQSSALLAVIGLINIPIIKFAVNAWNSIHQNSSVFRFDGIKIHESLLSPLILAFIAISLFYLTIGIVMMRNTINNMKRKRYNYVP